MDNEYQSWEKREEQPVKASPFSDSPYETAFQPQAPVPKQKKKIGKKGITLLLVVAVLLVVACAGTAVGVNTYWNHRVNILNDAFNNRMNVMQEKLDVLQKTPDSSTPSANPQISGTPGQVYAGNVQAVVAISNESLTTNFYGQVSKTASSGSGFIISEDGYVISNYHVVQGATKLSVILSDSTQYEAKLVGFDSTNDLAVLKIEATGLPTVKIGSSDALNVGDLVMAIGNPLGELTSTLTVGYVSAKDRMVSTDGSAINMLQTDAAINSGNSGGPLFNASGEVVGITTAKYSGTSNSGATIEGIGFAIPMDDVIGIIEDLVEHGYITGAYMGVMVKDMDSSVAQMYGFPMGVYVDEVTAGSCAEAAGIKAKDIIVNIGGYDIVSMSELSRALRRFEPGQTTTITVYRGGGEVHLSITLDEKPQQNQTEAQPTQPSAQQQIPGGGSIEDWFGGFFPGFGG